MDEIYRNQPWLTPLSIAGSSIPGQMPLSLRKSKNILYFTFIFFTILYTVHCKKSWPGIYYQGSKYPEKIFDSVFIMYFSIHYFFFLLDRNTDVKNSMSKLVEIYEENAKNRLEISKKSLDLKERKLALLEKNFNKK